MIQPSIPVRQALAKVTLPALVVAAFGVMLLGKADTLVAERARMALADALAPIYGALAEPLHDLRDAVDSVSGVFSLYEENARLRAENDRLRQWESVALTLEAENTKLKANLRWIPDPPANFVTVHVVADAGGTYARAVLLSLGPNRSIKKGQVALDQHGLVGRITEVGMRSARALLITDINSRIPVTVEPGGGHAILVGTNGPRPRLMYWEEGQAPADGDHVVTSAEAGTFPAGLPVGTVRYTDGKVAEVVPAAQLDKLDVVRIFDYGLQAIVPPEGPSAPRAVAYGRLRR